MAGHYLEDYTVGQRFTSPRLTLDAEEIFRFAAEFDPQPFHLDPEAAQSTLFAGLAASGWHTAALTMKLSLASDFPPAGGIIGAGFEEISWPRPVRPGDELHLVIDVLELRPSRSRPERGLMKVRFSTLNQRDEPVQISVGTLVVQSRATG